jgi:hypothetical protein
VHFSPFDGWDMPAGRFPIAEAIRCCGAAASRPEDRTGDEHDALYIAPWLPRVDRDGKLAGLLTPDLAG